MFQRFFRAPFGKTIPRRRRRPRVYAKPAGVLIERARLTILLGALLVVSSVNAAAGDKRPVVAHKPLRLRTYRFTAKIYYNGGVTPFKVGTKLTGQFTYDLSANDESNLKWQGLYRSPRNRIEIRYGKLIFSSQDEVRVGVGSHKKSFEGFGISGGKLKLPKGWSSLPDPVSWRDLSYLIVSLQNRPPRGVLPTTIIPYRLDFWKRFQTRTVRIDFIDGVHFPGGRIEKRAAIYAQLTQIEQKTSR